jgi:hypothetical protein
MPCSPCNAPSTNLCSSGNPCPTYPDAKCVVYTGSVLSCINVTTNQRLDAILANINAAICTAVTGITIEDEGVGQGKATTLNFVGDNVSVSTEDNIATITVIGSSSADRFGLEDNTGVSNRYIDMGGVGLSIDRALYLELVTTENSDGTGTNSNISINPSQTGIVALSSDGLTSKNLVIDPARVTIAKNGGTQRDVALSVNGNYADSDGDVSLSIPSNISLSAIGNTPNANGATLTGSTLNLEPADTSYGGIVTASNTAQSFLGQKNIVSATSTIFEGYSGSTLRTQLIDSGIQRWYLNSGSGEVGSISFSTPTTSGGTGAPGILFISDTNTGRSQIRQYLPTGGISIGAQTGNSPYPATQLVVLPNASVYVTGFASSDTSPVVDNGFTFNVTGTSCLSSTVLIGTTTDIPSAELVVESTTKGFLPPRMTTTEKNAISSPAEGLVVYDETSHQLEYYDGTLWQAPINIWKAILTCGYQVGQVNASTTTFGQLTGNNGGFQAENFKEYVIGEDCNVRNLFITTSGSQPGDGDLVVTIRYNLADTALTLTIPAGSSATSYSNTTDNFDLVAGGILTIEYANTATASSITITSSCVTLLGTGL